MKLEKILRTQSLEPYGYELLMGKAPRSVEEDWEFFNALIELAYPESLYVYFINIYPRTIIRHQDELYEILKDRENIVLEIIEEDTKEEEIIYLSNIKDYLGFKFCIDDFGRRSSNIDRLILLRPEFIKLDFELLKGYNLEVVENVKRLVHSIIPGVKLIAEKVETQEQYNIALALEIDFVQGYYFMHEDSGSHMLRP
ncbi:EAL domain-containing protein [Thermocrinis minervae]|uniref:EAL domain-containing protein n=1 Tax=Thermocrinis minervae TaxID=381751 RepID=A0A1M6T6N7_9AQUI|nr:EAL domain-containing protein [Thermocrinis minervae]SHK52574.1 EAL domain-containing protein [Thermocrinis minervae]